MLLFPFNLFRNLTKIVLRIFLLLLFYTLPIIWFINIDIFKSALALLLSYFILVIIESSIYECLYEIHEIPYIYKN